MNMRFNMRDPSKIITENYFNSKSENPTFSLSPPKGTMIHVFGDMTKPLNKMALSYVAKCKSDNIKFESSHLTQQAFNIDNVYEYNFGKGHFIQKVARVLCIDFPTTPKGYLPQPYTPEIGKIGICIDGIESSVGDIDDFVNCCPLNCSFVELSKRNWIDIAEWTQPKSTLDKIKILQTCEYVICGNNDIAHYAAALGVKLITIVNDAPANKLYLPCLTDYSNLKIQELYPQSCILHQSEENELVPKVSRVSLIGAVLGHVYPYWSDEYLKLVKN